jgi:hypothetical protein
MPKSACTNGTATGIDHTDAADGADRDRKAKPPPCRRRVDLAKLAIAQIHGATRQRIHDADLSWPAYVVNPARYHGYSAPIVMSWTSRCSRRRQWQYLWVGGGDRDPPIRHYFQKTKAI